MSTGLELTQAIVYRREFQEECLLATCARCLIPRGLAGLPLDEPCPECGATGRMDWDQLDSLRNDNMDVYLEHRQEMTSYVRQQMAMLGYSYVEKLS
jgi:hypothetical protein